MRATIPDTMLSRALSFGPRKLYEGAVRARAALFEKGVFRARRLDRPVISVGNLTFGGTGKTPLVETIAAALGREGCRVAILTRGYRRAGTGRVVLRATADGTLPEAYEKGGDEPALLARRVVGATVIVEADRYAAGRWAERELDPDVFVLDDGFQHLRLARDLNILVVDATNPFGGMEMAPFGTLREPLSAMRRADAVIVTRASRPYDTAVVQATIRDACGEEIPVLFVDHEVQGIVPLGGGSARSAESLRGRTAGVLAALGNPDVLLDDLARAGVDVVSRHLLPDHHDYIRRDVDAAVASARDAGAEFLLTTHKDAVKLERLGPTSIPVFVVEIAFSPEHRDRIARLCLDAVRSVVRRGIA
jgi:tetraacyldisaccharide 4'-kinase